MNVNVTPIKEFKEKIKMYIPFHEVSILPRIGDVEGQSFKCGCGESHIMNFDQHYFIADGGMFKAEFFLRRASFFNDKIVFYDRYEKVKIEDLKFLEFDK